MKLWTSARSQSYRLPVPGCRKRRPQATSNRQLATLALAAILISLPSVSFAQESVFTNHDFGRFWISGQMNFIYQEHGPFRAAYSGANSLRPVLEDAMSRLMTIYTGYQVSKTTDILVDFERMSGGGISQTVGLAGFTNLDVVRNPQLSTSPYVARLMLHTVIPLSSDWQRQDRNPMSVLPAMPSRYVELRAGKFSVVDFFDVNSVGSDSHLQFMNWAIDNNGAYDYVADTRGYTWGVFAEYHDGWWSARGAIALMPYVANGIHYDHDVRRDRGENLEFESRRALIAGRSTVVRLLLYRNLARMGIYRDALRIAEATHSTPDIAADDRPGRAKTGVGLNFEQELTERIRVFARAGWNDGRTESFAYTEIDRTIAVGADTRVPRRPHDRVGVAFVSNALSADHRDYLAAGGLGFIIGDGALNYGHEKIVESYYTMSVLRGLSVAGDLQWIHSPAYNRDRGPVTVGSLRLHVDF